MQTLKQTLQKLLLPIFCLHCQQPANSHLCKACQDKIEFLDSSEVCLWCSNPRDTASLLCSCCHLRKKERTMLLARIIACCKACPEVHTLMNALSNKKWCKIADLFAAMLAVRFLDDIDIPLDLITFSPLYFLKAWQFHPAREIATRLATYLKCPSQSLLRLVHPEPQTLQDLHAKKPLWNKTILLIHPDKKDQHLLDLYSRKLLGHGAWKVLILTVV